MKNLYKSDLSQTIHELAKDLNEMDLLSDKEMREYDRNCLVASPKPAYENTGTPVQTIPVYASSNPKRS